MRINNVENAQNFGSVYKVKATMNNIKRFDEAVAPIYRSVKKNGIRAFIRNVSDMYVMTGKDAYEFDRKFNQLLRDKVELKGSFKKLGDNVVMIPVEEHQFMNNFLRKKEIEPMSSFKNLLIKIFN